MKNLILLVLFLGMGYQAKSQKFINRQESILTQQKWTIMKVKGRKSNFEIGETLWFDVNHKFDYKSNSYDIVSGTWKLDSKSLLLVIDSYKKQTEERKKIPTLLKVKRLTKDQIILKYKLERRGTLWLK